MNLIHGAGDENNKRDENDALLLFFTSKKTRHNESIISTELFHLTSIHLKLTIKMTQKYDDVENKGKNDEPEIFATAVPAAHNEPPIPAGHARFYCSKCHTVSALGVTNV
jgi:hypothetical protein